MASAAGVPPVSRARNCSHVLRRGRRETRRGILERPGSAPAPSAPRGGRPPRCGALFRRARSRRRLARLSAPWPGSVLVSRRWDGWADARGGARAEAGEPSPQRARRPGLRARRAGSVWEDRGAGGPPPGVAAAGLAGQETPAG